MERTEKVRSSFWKFRSTYSLYKIWDFDIEKMSVFVHAQGIKTVHAGGGGQKKAKFCPRSCWMTPYEKLLNFKKVLSYL